MVPVALSDVIAAPTSLVGNILPGHSPQRYRVVA